MTKTIQFTIKGNPKDQEGNPFPCAEKAEEISGTSQSDRWNHWADYVRSVFRLKYAFWEWWNDEYPFTTRESQRAKMSIIIFWTNGFDTDPAEIFGCISEILFQSVSHLDGSFESRYASDGKGRVDVVITLNI